MVRSHSRLPIPYLRRLALRPFRDDLLRTILGESHAQVPRQHGRHHLSDRPGRGHPPAQSSSSEVRAGARALALTIVLLLLGGRRARGRRRRRARRPQRRNARRGARLARARRLREARHLARRIARRVQGRRRADPPGARALRLLRRRNRQEPHRRRAATAGRRDSTSRPASRPSCASERVEVHGEGKEQRRVAEAVAGFAPKVGDRLDHATYEASKAVIDTSLRGAGFLDAKITQRQRHRAAGRTNPPTSTSLGQRPALQVRRRALRGRRAVPGRVPAASSCPGAKAPSSTPSRCSTCSSGWSMRTTSSWCPCSRRSTRRRTARVPIDVLLNRDERTVYSGEVYYSTDFGAGVRVGAERRWLNKKGHKADVAGRVFAAPAGSARFTTRFRGRAAKTAPTISASPIATRPPTSPARAISSSRPRAREKRWHGFTRTLGLKYLDGDFEIGQDEDNLEFGESTTAVRRRHAEPAPGQRPARAAQRLRARVGRAARQRSASSPIPTSRRPAAGSPG